MDNSLSIAISRQEIAAAVERLARELDRAYTARSPVMVGVLKGAFIFLADLVREMKISLGGVEFIRIASYDSNQVTSGQPAVLCGLNVGVIEGRDVVIVEDIVDTGLTTSVARRYLEQCHPSSLQVCALLDKPSRRRVTVNVDYVGFTIPDQFVVGYGLDFDQRYRQLPAIYTLCFGSGKPVQE